MTEIAANVRRRAGDCCEYCLLPQPLFRRPFHIEHIVAKQHGGQTDLDNLALACWQCNLKKGPNLTGIDPDTGEVTRLFNPLKDRWTAHFAFTQVKSTPRRMEIAGLRAVGRATAHLLALNEYLRQIVRYEVLVTRRLSRH